MNAVFTMFWRLAKLWTLTSPTHFREQALKAELNLGKHNNSALKKWPFNSEQKLPATIPQLEHTTQEHLNRLGFSWGFQPKFWTTIGLRWFKVPISESYQVKQKYCSKQTKNEKPYFNNVRVKHVVLVNSGCPLLELWSCTECLGNYDCLIGL